MIRVNVVYDRHELLAKQEIKVNFKVSTFGKQTFDSTYPTEAGNWRYLKYEMIRKQKLPSIFSFVT